MATNIPHTYRNGDKERGEEACRLLGAFLASPAVKKAIGHERAVTVTDKDENLERGDIRLEWADGSIVYFEGKSVSHDITAADGRDRGYLTQKRWGNGFPTTFVEVAKRREKAAPHTVDPQDKVWRALTLNGSLDPRQEGWDHDTYLAAGITLNRKKSPEASPTKWAAVEYAHTNLLPYAAGAVAAFIDLQERSINFHLPADLMRAIYTSITTKGIYDSPGNVDPGGLIARHIPYGRYGVAWNEGLGAWCPITPRGNDGTPDDTRRLLASLHTVAALPAAA